MNETLVPVFLENYYRELTVNKSPKSVPNCPICKKKMVFEEYEPIFTSIGEGYIRRFRCTNCKDNEVILWRR